VPEPHTGNFRSYLYAALGLILLFLLGLGSGLMMNSFLTPGVIVSGVKVEDIDLRGLTAEEAKAALEPTVQALAELQLFLHARDHTFASRVGEIGIAPDVELTLAQALAVGHRGNLWRQIQERRQVHRDGVNIPFKISVNEERLKGYLSQLAQQVDVSAQDAYLVLNEKKGAERVPERIGLALDQEASQKRIIAAVENRLSQVELVVREIIPERTLEDLDRQGIREVVAVFTTRFDAANQDRSYNLKLGAAAIDGYVVEPGAVFSFNEVVGPREAEQGYREAPVIIENELVPGVGGGICQVSSTLYNAVLLAGLNPLERSNHSLPVAYVGLGRDATVAYGSIDFKFRNNRPESVMLGTRVAEGEITVAIFGTKRQGEKVDIVTTVEEEIPFPVLFQEDPTLQPGETRLKQEGKPGYRVTVQRIIKRAGQETREEILSRDRYHPQPEVHLVGPGTDPLPTGAGEEPLFLLQPDVSPGDAQSVE
jgi:vancomycin resistance protein YoaR